MPVSTLMELARLVDGEPEEALRRLLTLTCEQLAMDLAFVSVLDGAGNRTVRQSVHADGTPGPVGLTGPVEDTWCGRVIEQGSTLIRDGRGDAGLMALPSTALHSIVSYAGVPLCEEDGTVFGALCAVGHEPHGSLNPRDLEVLSGLAEVMVPLVRRLDGPPAPPASRAAGPTTDEPPTTGLDVIAAAVEGADDVERLSRPLLDALRSLTGLASAYLTVVHEDDDAQEVRYALNTRADFEIPEGLHVPWSDTLCKRALDEGRPCTTDVPSVWGDSQAARALGIQVYVSVPVETSGGQVWGTLCAADSLAADAVEEHLPTMRLFARLIGAQVEREEAVAQARQEASTDALTQCASQRAVDPWLAAQLATLTPDEVIVAAFADLDSFKQVNDTLGHAAGDAVLIQVGHRLRSVARPHDLVARLGGDEFLVAARLPRDAAGPLIERVRNALVFSMPWQATTVHVRGSVGAALSDGHDGRSLIANADAAMYVDKRQSRAS